MTTTPLPPAKGYTDTAEVKCKCGRPVPVHVCVKDLYTPPEVQQARADLEAEVARLRAQMQTIKDYAGNPEIVWKTAVAALKGSNHD